MIENVKNLYSLQASSRPRVAEKLLAICGRLLEQTEEGIDPKVYDAAASIAVDLFETSERTLRNSLRAYLYAHVLSSFKYCVDEIKSLGPQSRLSLCGVINALDEIEAAASAESFVIGAVPSFRSLTSLVADVTQYESEKSGLMVKMKLMRDSAKNDADAETICSLALQLLQSFTELPVSLVHATLDLLISAASRDSDLHFVQSAINVCVTCANRWNDAVRAQILVKLIELCRVALCLGLGFEKLENLIQHDVSKVLGILCVQRPSMAEEDETVDPYNNWMSGVASRAIECVSLAVERDSEQALATLVESLATSINQIASRASDSFKNVVNHEKVLRRSLELVHGTNSL